MIKENKCVLLGMSGGTDSSIAAMRLLSAGYEVIGITFRFYELNDSTGYLDDARHLAARLGIKHITYDARKIFKEQIIEYFVQTYLAGHTPVPCTLCNSYLKWPLLAKTADEMGVFHIATGHYARIVKLKEDYYITHAADSDKDQTFFLWGLKKPIIRRIILPMGDVTKVEARAWAAEHGYQELAMKKDSLGVCFCPMDYRSFLKDWLIQNNQLNPGTVKRGRFVDEEGSFIAWHEGYPFYTIGQRHGLGVHLNRPVFVKEIRPSANEIVLAPLKALEKMEMYLKDWNIVNKDMLLNHSDIIVKIRYRKQENHCTVTITPDNLLHVQLHEPLTAIAIGQAAVFYKNGYLLGGGIITEQSYTQKSIFNTSDRQTMKALK